MTKEGQEMLSVVYARRVESRKAKSVFIGHEIQYCSVSPMLKVTGWVKQTG